MSVIFKIPSNNEYKFKISHNAFRMIAYFFYSMIEEDKDMNIIEKLYKEKYNEKVLTLKKEPMFPIISLGYMIKSKFNHEKINEMGRYIIENMENIEKYSEVFYGIKYKNNLLFKPFIELILKAKELNQEISFSY